MSTTAKVAKRPRDIKANAIFCAASHQDIPALIASHRAMAARIEQLEAGIREAIEDIDVMRNRHIESRPACPGPNGREAVSIKTAAYIAITTASFIAGLSLGRNSREIPPDRPAGPTLIKALEGVLSDAKGDGKEALEGYVRHAVGGDELTESEAVSIIRAYDEMCVRGQLMQPATAKLPE